MKSAVQGRENCPRMKGSNNWTITAPKEPHPMGAEPVVGSRAIISNGVRITPSRFDVVAETMAPAILPPAMDVNVIDDCTVDGTSVRKASPSARPGEYQGRCSRPRPMIGNTTKVQAKIVRCSRQCFRPAHASAVDRRAP